MPAAPRSTRSSRSSAFALALVCAAAAAVPACGPRRDAPTARDPGALADPDRRARHP